MSNIDEGYFILFFFFTKRSKDVLEFEARSQDDKKEMDEVT